MAIDPDPGITPPRWGRGLSLALTLFPLLVLLYKLPQYVLDFPYWDDLILVPFIEKAQAGQLSLAEVWTQHNEHRVFFPRLVMLGIALLTRWDVRWTVGLSLVLGIGIFLLLALLVRRTAGRGWAEWAAYPALACFVFSWAQMENWVWSLEVTVFLCNIAVVAGVFLLWQSQARPAWILLAMACGIVTTYSFANGMIYWLAALPSLVFLPFHSKRQRMTWCAVWLLTGTAAILFYFLDYRKPGVSPSLLTVLQAPHEYLGYVLLYLGSPVVAVFSAPPWHGGPPHPIGFWHFLPGAVGVLLALGLAVAFWRLRVFPLARLAPWMSLAAFAIGSAMATGIGRVGLGIYQALVSRYMTTNLLFWCALVGAAAVLASSMAPLPAKYAGRTRAALATGVALLILFTAMTVHHSRGWEENVTWKRLGWRALASGFESPLYLADLCWDPQALQEEYLPFLRKHRLAGLEPAPPPPDPALAEDYIREGEEFFARGLLRPALTYADTALHFDPGHPEAAQLREKVLLAVRNR